MAYSHSHLTWLQNLDTSLVPPDCMDMFVILLNTDILMQSTDSEMRFKKVRK